MKEVGVGLKTLTSLLGDEHNLTVLRNELRRLRKKSRLDISEDLFAATVGLVERRREELHREAIPLGERIFSDRPRAMAARIAARASSSGRSAASPAAATPSSIPFRA